MPPRLPRDLSGRELVVIPRRYGYEITRTSGGHVRLTTQTGGEHHITVPSHDPLRLGTLAGILDAVAQHNGLTRDSLVGQLWP